MPFTIPRYSSNGFTRALQQPGDITINKPLKNRTCALHYRHVSETTAEHFHPGQKIKLSCKKLFAIALVAANNNINQ